MDVEDMTAPLTRDAEQLQFNGHPMPRWVEDFQLRRIRRDPGRRGRLQLEGTAGPAIQWGWAGLILLTYFLTALPVVGYYVARCPSGENVKAFAEYPEKILWLIFFAPMAVSVLLIQWKASTYLLVPMVQTIQENAERRNVSGDVLLVNIRLRFMTFYILGCVLTVFNLLDQMTNGLFAAKTIATQHCYANSIIDHGWDQVLNQSTPVFKKASDQLGDFADVTYKLYMLQLILQPLVALAFSIPLTTRRVDYTIKDGAGETETYKTLQDNLCDSHDTTSHIGPAIILAEANRWEVIVAGDFQCQESNADLEIYELDRALEAADEAATEEHMKKLRDLCQGTLSRAMMRYLLKGLLQNAVQINLQVSLLALSMQVLKTVDPFNAASTGLTVVGMLLDVPDMIRVYGFTNKICSALDRALERHPQSRVRPTGLRVRRFCVGVFQILYVLVAVYALTKLLMALFVCHGGGWNMNDMFEETHGCVNISLPETSPPSCFIQDHCETR